MESSFISLFWIALCGVIAPLLAGLIPRRLVPEVVILLIAGMVIGPFGLGLAQTDDAIGILRELGLAMLFLLAGFEVELDELTGRSGRRALGTWGACFALALVAGLLRRAAGRDPRRGRHRHRALLDGAGHPAADHEGRWTARHTGGQGGDEPRRLGRARTGRGHGDPARHRRRRSGGRGDHHVRTDRARGDPAVAAAAAGHLEDVLRHPGRLGDHRADHGAVDGAAPRRAVRAGRALPAGRGARRLRRRLRPPSGDPAGRRAAGAQAQRPRLRDADPGVLRDLRDGHRRPGRGRSADGADHLRAPHRGGPRPAGVRLQPAGAGSGHGGAACSAPARAYGSVSSPPPGCRSSSRSPPPPSRPGR